jgi:hypothetical protein
MIFHLTRFYLELTCQWYRLEHLAPAVIEPRTSTTSEGPMGSSIFGSADPGYAGHAMPLNSDLRLYRAGISHVRIGGRLS